MEQVATLKAEGSSIRVPLLCVRFFERALTAHLWVEVGEIELIFVSPAQCASISALLVELIVLEFIGGLDRTAVVRLMACRRIFVAVVFMLRCIPSIMAGRGRKNIRKLEAGDTSGEKCRLVGIWICRAQDRVPIVPLTLPHGTWSRTRVIWLPWERKGLLRLVHGDPRIPLAVRRWVGTAPEMWISDV